jgi:hypothetical protein
MKDYIVRYEQIYSTVIRAESEQDAIRKAHREDFILDETSEFEAEEQSE